MHFENSYFFLNEFHFSNVNFKSTKLFCFLNAVTDTFLKLSDRSIYSLSTAQKVLRNIEIVCVVIEKRLLKQYIFPRSFAILKLFKCSPSLKCFHLREQQIIKLRQKQL